MDKIDIQPKEMTDSNILYLVGVVALCSIFIGMYLIVPDPTEEKVENCHSTLCHQF